MSFRIYILGDRSAEVSRREVAEFVAEGCYFDSPVFRPDASSAEAAELEWGLLEVFERVGARPVRLHSEKGSRVASTIDIVVGTFDERGVELPQPVSARLEATRHVYVVEIDRGGGISDDAWEMLSCLEAFLARRCGGIIFTSEDGVYDADLRLLVNFK